MSTHTTMTQSNPSEPDEQRHRGRGMKQKNPRLKKSKPENPIEAAVKAWSSSLAIRDDTFHIQTLIAQTPKRWTVYQPMVLLPSGSFSSPPWSALISTISKDEKDSLWPSILASISQKTGTKTSLTHLAVNEGIPLLTESTEIENILRSPSGLRMLHGDFGPADITSTDGIPTEQDFEQAFWVNTNQNGIYQTWAPRWTMFSRGNVKEKARLLSFHSPGEEMQHRVVPIDQLRKTWAVDLYAGIGYFVFSYAKLGLPVLCWELNPWSVEGLRRGAEGNSRMSVKVIQGGGLEGPMGEVLAGGQGITVFLENNEEALGRIRGLRKDIGLGRLEDRRDVIQWGPFGSRHDIWERGLEIRHVNCGLLPTSEDRWRDAWAMVSEGDMEAGKGAWLHLHENVGVKDIETRKAEIQKYFESPQQTGSPLTAIVEHVELVKTFAPGVWHCVFDVYIQHYSGTT